MNYITKKQNISKNCLVIGGTSGLGLELALCLQKNGHSVFVTGRNNPNQEKISYIRLDITSNVEKFSKDLGKTLDESGPIHTLVYAAGFFQEGVISELNDADIITMTNIGLVGPALLLQKILQRQDELKNFIAITSTSQWIPRLKEPVYTSVKAGISMLAHSISLDQRVKKTLVVGPSGMDTKIWKNREKEDSGILLEPAWTAKKILELNNGKFNYKLARILRDPKRIEIIKQE